MSDKTFKEQGSLSIHTENIFPIIKKWLYSEHDIFLRELIANSVDAISKRLAIDENCPKTAGIEIKIDKEAKTIQIIDEGIGMTADEIKKYINQIAFSGAEDFIEKYKDKNIIGHFGLGFYSAFMVAEKVTIDSLSYTEGSKPAFWECTGETEYRLDDGTRLEAGTTITVHLNKESEIYAEEAKIKELVQKYCNFMPYDIELGGNVLNQKQALWNKKPSDVKDEEYIDFYKKSFNDYEDPLFWIHLNVDFPFRLKGILYFPKIKNMMDVNRGNVKLYCSNVFVAENLKEFIPEFLLLLKGGIDVPDIPLNVSRSFLQHDGQVKQITSYIIKKVSEHLNNLFKDDRKKFEQYWIDIDQFIKFGILTEEKFYDKIKDTIIFKSSKGDFVTVEEYKERNKRDEKPLKMYYSKSEDTQVSYLKIMEQKGHEVLFTSSPLDTHIMQHLEMKNNNEISFVRIDSEINNNLVDEEKSKQYFDEFKTEIEEEKTTTDDEGKEKTETVKTEVDTRQQNFEKVLNKPAVSVEVKSLVTPEIPGMIVFNEQMRRFHEMNYLASNTEFDMLANHKFVVNYENDTIKKILELKNEGDTENAETLAQYVHELSLLEQKAFKGKELKSFIEKANKVLSLLK